MIRNEAIENFFWPSKPKAEVGALGRAGRVLHWIALFFASFWLLGAVFSFNSPGTDITLGYLCAGAGVFTAQLGRGARYILAGE